MKHFFLAIFLIFIFSYGLAQTDKPIANDYLSDEDSILLSVIKRHAPVIHSIKEYMKAKNYGDTLKLLNQYTFNQEGLLTSRESFDVYGKSTHYLYESDSSGYLYQLTNVTEQRIVAIASKNKSYPGQETKITYDFKERPVLAIEYFDGKEIERTYYQYKNKEVTQIVKKEDQLVLTETQRFYRNGLLKKHLIDERMYIKRIPKRKLGKGLTHHIPARYAKRKFKYTDDGKVRKMTSSNHPIFRELKIVFTYDSTGKLKEKIKHEKGRSKKTFHYQYTVY